MIRQFASRQFLVFLVTGGCAALVNLGSRLVYSQWLAFSSAVIFAYLTGMVTAFVLARLFVFRTSTQSMQRTVLFFILVNVLAILQTWGISMLMRDWALPALGVVQHTELIAHACGVVVPVLTSYLGHKYWSFR